MQILRNSPFLNLIFINATFILFALITFQSSYAAVFGKISGQVTNSQGVPLSNIEVRAYRIGLFDTSSKGSAAITDTSGNYLIEGLPNTGDYYLRFIDLSGRFISQGYPTEVPFSYYSIGKKTAISVTLGQETTEIDLQMSSTPGKISGRVTTSLGLPLSNIEVAAYHQSHYDLPYTRPSQTTTTDASGNYLIRELSIAGDYYLHFKDLSERFVSQGYQTEVPFNYEDIGTKTPVNVTHGQTTTGVDLHMSTIPGRISGQVTDSQGVPLSNIRVIAHFKSHSTGSPATTDAFGNYLIKGLSSNGDYYLRFYDLSRRFVSQGYPTEVPFDGGAIGTKTAVNVTLGRITTGIDLQMSTIPGGISGQVIDSQGVPLSNIKVTAYRESIFGFGYTSSPAITDASGNYLIKGLFNSGDHYLGFQDLSDRFVSQGYQTEVPFNSSGRGTKTAVSVTINQVTTGINQKMSTTPGKISGQVTDSQGMPLSNIKVTAYSNGRYGLSSTDSTATTDASGNYLIKGLSSTGDYYLGFKDLSDRFVSQGYPTEIPFYHGGIGTKIPVNVTLEQTTTGIDLQMSTIPGGISGQVSDSQGVPLSNIKVTAYSNGRYGLGSSGSPATTDASGNYLIKGLPSTGGYYLGFIDLSDRFVSQGYQTEVPFNSSGRGTKTPVRVTQGQITTGIDLQMSTVSAGISGQVTDSQGMPLSNIKVSAYLDNNTRLSSTGSPAITDASGNYLIKGLSSSEDHYLAFEDLSDRFVSQGYQTEVPLGSYYVGTKTAVSVTVSQITTGINLQMSTTTGKISGQITDLHGAVLPNVEVIAYRTNSSGYELSKVSSPVVSDANGNYLLEGLTRVGDHYLQFNDLNGNFITQGYQTEIPFDSDYIGNKTAVNVTFGQTTSGINMQMTRASIVAPIPVMSFWSLLVLGVTRLPL